MQRITKGLGGFGRFIGRTTRGPRQSIGYRARWAAGGVRRGIGRVTTPFRRRTAYNERDQIIDLAMVQALKMLREKPTRNLFEAESLGWTSWVISVQRSKGSGNILVSIAKSPKTVAGFTMNSTGSRIIDYNPGSTKYLTGALNRKKRQQ